MKMMRGKMTRCRKRQELLEKRKQKILNRQRVSKTYKGKRIIEAKDVIRQEIIQDKDDLVVTGADVEGLYPSLSDIEVALIVFEAIMNSGIKFENIDFRLAGKYISMHLTEEEQRVSPLWRILPRRTTRNGVRPGVSADPRNEENC